MTTALHTYGNNLYIYIHNVQSAPFPEPLVSLVRKLRSFAMNTWEFTGNDLYLVDLSY